MHVGLHFFHLKYIILSEYDHNTYIYSQFAAVYLLCIRLHEFKSYFTWKESTMLHLKFM